MWQKCIHILFLSFVVQVTFSLVYDNCINNSTCTDQVEHTYCKSIGPNDYFGAACVCEPGYFRSWDNKRCVRPSVLIGDSCEESQECLAFATVQETICLPGAKVCDCPSGYIHSNDMVNCLRIVDTLDNEECVEDIQCQLGKPGARSICGRKSKGSEVMVCRCHEKSVDDYPENVCIPKAPYWGGSCRVQAQCTTVLKYGRCIHSLCRCNQGYEVSSDKYRCNKV